MTFPKRLLIDDEQLVIDTRPHWIALVAPVLVIVLVVLAWIIALPNLPDGSAGDVLRWVLIGAGVVVIAAFSVRRIVDWLTDNFCVTSDRIIHRHGLIAKKSMEVPLEHINDVRFQQKIWERMIGAGTIVIHSASEAGRQEFKNVRNPEHVQKTIYHEGEKNQQRMRGGLQVPQAPTVTSELHRLADLRDRGVLTPQEFEEQKARILGGTTPAP
ncbi:MAG: PH domain-containing protein [Actinomycetota bacterium]